MQPGNPGDLGAFGVQVPPQQVPPQAAVAVQQLQAALAQAHVMQHRLMEAQQQIARAQVHGYSADGMVGITLNGSGQVMGIRIEPQVVNPNDIATLENDVLGAFHAAAENMRQTVKQILGPLAAQAQAQAQAQRQPGQQPGS